jgi:hypothetical protein
MARKKCTRASVVQEIQRGRTFGRRRQQEPEYSNGIRDRGLKQKLEGSKRMKDLGGRLPLRPRNEMTSRWTYGKTIDSMKIAKKKAGSYAASRKIKD